MGVLQELLLKPTVRIRDPTQLQAKLDTIIQGGFDRLLVISDFDYTLSRYKARDGERCWTTHGVFESATEQFSPELKAKFDELKTKYIPIEYCPNMTVAEKTPYMEQWWTESHEFIVQQKFTRSQIEDFVTRSKLALRDGAEQLLETVERHRVPLVLFSAGIGNIIEIFLRRQLSTIPPSLHIVSNMMQFDEDDICTSFSEPLIHTFCKNASVIDHELPFFKSLRERTNVILLGDSFGDLQMDVGVEREGVALKIGFLNFNVDQLLDKYMHGFDIVLVDDQTMDVPLTVFNHVRERLQVVYSSPSILQENDENVQNDDLKTEVRRVISSAANGSVEPVRIFVPNADDEGDDEP